MRPLVGCVIPRIAERINVVVSIIATASYSALSSLSGAVRVRFELVGCWPVVPQLYRIGALRELACDTALMKAQKVAISP